MRIGMEDVVDLTTQIFAAAVEPSRWQGLMNNIRHASGGVRTHLFVHDQALGRAATEVNSGYDPDYVRSFLNHYSGINAWAPVFSSSPTGTVLSGMEMCPDADMEKTEFYNDWIRPQDDVIGGGGAVIWNDPRRTILFGGNIRRKDRDRLEGDWMRLVTMLASPLQQAFEMSRTLMGKSLEQLALSSNERGHPAILVVSARRQLLYANPVAQSLLEEGGVVTLDAHSRVDFAEQSAATAFAGAIFSIRLLDRTHATEFHATDPVTGGRYLCRTARLAQDKAIEWSFAPLATAPEPCLLVTLQPLAQDRDTAALLKARFGLTQGEAAGSIALSEGKSPADIAGERGVSIHTVRNQLKAAMAKLGVHRQTELVREVLRVTAASG